MYIPLTYVQCTVISLRMATHVVTDNDEDDDNSDRGGGGKA